MPNSRYLILLLTVVTVGSVGCSKTQDAPSSAADGNLAPVSDTGQYPNQAPNQAPVRTTAPAPNYRSTAAPAYQNYQDYPDNSYSDQPDYSGQLVYASQPPPPLPEYSQPPCPGDNYIWTPGNWNYGNAGYYWVPGAWVLAPYVDALWTPPYWEYSGDRYRWHRGYWGRHIGFYGGIDYGFGYTGRGYYGGYWNGGRFNYNRSVTNVNVNIVQNVYERNVSVGRVSRVSFNGPGGINVRPIPAEIAVLHEARTAPIPAQIQHARAAQENRSQFAAVNRGRPAIIAQAQPLGTNYRAPSDRPAAAEQLRPLPAQPSGRPPVPEQRAAAPGQFAPPDQRPGERPTRLQIDGPRNQPAPFQREQSGRIQSEARPLPQQQQVRPEPAAARPELARQPLAPAPAPAPQQRPVFQERPAPQRQLPPPPQARQLPPFQQERAEPRTRPAPEARPADPIPVPRPVRQEARPAPPPRPAPEARPAPVQVARPAPESKPAPAGRPAGPPPHEKHEEKERR